MALKETPTLQDFQSYFAELEVKRGFESLTILQKNLMLGEEVGELFKAIRKREGVKTDPASAVSEVEHELSDVFSFVLAIANHYNIDLEQAWRSKDAINEQRTWRADV